MVGAIAGGLLFWLVRQSLGDDSYITLSYVKNLAERGEWALVPGVTANSATSPLNVLTLGALSFLTRITGATHPIVALGAQLVILGALLGWAWQRLVKLYSLPIWVALIGLGVVLANPIVVATVGLEVVLIPTAITWLAVLAAERRVVAYGVVSGLAILTRMDLVVFVLIIAVATAAIRRRIWLAAGVAAAVCLPWFGWSWVALGSAIPDTLSIKQNAAKVFGNWDYASGLTRLYLQDSPRISFAVAASVIGILALVAWLGIRFSRTWESFPSLGPVAALGGGGIAYFVAYMTLGVPPFSWYYVAPLVSLATAGVVLVGAWLAASRSRLELRRAGPLIVLCALAVIAVGAISIDVRLGLPWPTSRKTGNWASTGEYTQMGRELGARLGGRSTSSPGEIGTLVYFCECRIFDEFSDRGLAAAGIRARLDKSSAPAAALLRLNYLWFDLDQAPQRLDYNLRYDKKKGSGPDVWNITEGNRAGGHFALVPAKKE